jgi:hypothetical protein
MPKNQTESKPADAEQESGKGFDGTACVSLLDQVAVYNASAETVTSTEVHDCWWEFETEDNRDLKGWMPIPPIPHNASRLASANPKTPNP